MEGHVELRKREPEFLISTLGTACWRSRPRDFIRSHCRLPALYALWLRAPASGLGGQQVIIYTPKSFPVIGHSDLQISITRDTATQIRIIRETPDQPRTNRVFKYVVDGPDERFAFSLFVSEDVVVRLSLPRGGQKRRTKVFAEKLDCVSLVGAVAEPEADEVQVVRHQHVSRTHQTVTSACVEQTELPAMMKRLGEPASRTAFDGKSPMHRGEAVVETRRKTRQVALGLGRQRRTADWPVGMAMYGFWVHLHPLVGARG